MDILAVQFQPTLQSFRINFSNVLLLNSDKAGRIFGEKNQRQRYNLDSGMKTEMVLTKTS